MTYCPICQRGHSEADPLYQEHIFPVLYRLAQQVGDKRYGSPCKHLRTQGGLCVDCKRKVVV